MCGPKQSMLSGSHCRRDTGITWFSSGTRIVNMYLGTLDVYYVSGTINVYYVFGPFATISSPGNEEFLLDKNMPGLLTDFLKV